MTSRLLMIGLIVFSQSLTAGQVNRSSVDYEAGVYSMSFDVEIDADLKTVRAIVTDYANLARLSDMLVESRLITPPGSEPIRRLLVVHGCVLFFCRNVRMVEQVKEVGPDVFITTVIPELSDFKSGTTRWQLAKLSDQRTGLKFQCREEPDFWIPPFIGPILIKHRLAREAQVVINNIEKVAADG